uniref:hypothetical protein n=1 Tax=Schlesneria paludicola TaxID=360056 RepID=UPI00029B3C1F
MSRKRGRQTLQNRHRPLLPGQLKRRFIRERQLRRVEFEASLALLEPDNDYYEHWNNYDYFDQWGDHEDLIRFEFNQELNRLLNPGSPLVASSLIASSSAPIEEEITSFVPPTDDDTGTQSILDRLRNLLQRGQPIATLRSSLEHTFERLTRPATETAIVRCQSIFKHSSLTKNLCWFAQFWIRDPATWQNGDEKSLVEHLLARRNIEVDPVFRTTGSHFL